MLKITTEITFRLVRALMSSNLHFVLVHVSKKIESCAQLIVGIWLS